MISAALAISASIPSRVSKLDGPSKKVAATMSRSPALKVREKPRDCSKRSVSQKSAQLCGVSTSSGFTTMEVNQDIAPTPMTPVPSSKRKRSERFEAAGMAPMSSGARSPPMREALMRLTGA